jgi:hypothetical protein
LRAVPSSSAEASSRHDSGCGRQSPVASCAVSQRPADGRESEPNEKPCQSTDTTSRLEILWRLRSQPLTVVAPLQRGASPLRWICVIKGPILDACHRASGTHAFNETTREDPLTRGDDLRRAPTTRRFPAWLVSPASRSRSIGRRALVGMPSLRRPQAEWPEGDDEESWRPR